MPKKPKNPTPSVEQTRELLAHLTQTCVLWNEEIMEGWFEDPTDSWALQMLVEAHAQALAVMAAQHPDKPALVDTFIEELRDNVQYENKS